MTFAHTIHFPNTHIHMKFQNIPQHEPSNETTQHFKHGDIHPKCPTSFISSVPNSHVTVALWPTYDRLPNNLSSRRCSCTRRLPHTHTDLMQIDECTLSEGSKTTSYLVQIGGHVANAHVSRSRFGIVPNLIGFGLTTSHHPTTFRCGFFRFVCLLTFGLDSLNYVNFMGII